jgi:hypothetical protein
MSIVSGGNVHNRLQCMRKRRRRRRRRRRSQITERAKDIY